MITVCRWNPPQTFFPIGMVTQSFPENTEFLKHVNIKARNLFIAWPLTLDLLPFKEFAKIMLMKVSQRKAVKIIVNSDKISKQASKKLRLLPF